MKHLFTLIMLCLCTMAASAEDFKSDITVTAGEPTTMKDQTVVIDRTSDTEYKLTIKDLKMMGFSIGDVTLNTQAKQNADGSVSLSYEGDQTFNLPALGSFPVHIKITSATISEGNLTAEISITNVPLVNTVQISIKGTSTGIEGVNATKTKTVSKVFGLNGTRVNEMQKGKVYVVRYTDGTTAKVLK